MKSNYLLVALALLAFVVSGCGKQETDAPSTTVEFTLLSGQDHYTLEDTAREYGRDNDLTISCSADVYLPVQLFDLNVAPLCDKIMEVAFDTVCAEPSEAMGLYFKDFADSFGYHVEPADSAAIADGIEGFSTVQGDVRNLSPRMLTYRVYIATYYPGAAHGMQNTSYITFDLLKGQIVTLDNLFTAEGLDALPAIISRRAKKLEAQLGETSIDALPSGGNFFISLEDEIVFVYQPYEVASYAQGMIHVPFYPYELTEYLTPYALTFLGLDEDDEI